MNYFTKGIAHTLDMEKSLMNLSTLQSNLVFHIYILTSKRKDEP